MTSYTNIFGGEVTNTANQSLLNLTLTGSITLSWPSQFQDVNTNVYNIMNVTASGVYNITLPDATQTSVGQTILFVNAGGVNTYTVLNNAGATIVAIPASDAFYLYLSDNTTAAGIWHSVPFASGGPVVTSVGLVALNNNLVITNSPVTTSGNIDITIANDLLALASFGGSTGISARTGANTWALRTITGTANQIAVANGTGVAGNPTISLPSAVQITTSLQVANLTMSVNTIGTTNAGGITMGDVVNLPVTSTLNFFASNGTNFNTFTSGTQAFNQIYIWPTVAPVAGQVMGYNGANDLAWFSIPTFGGSSTTNALAKYLNTSGSLTNSGVILDAFNNMTGINSAGIANIQIGVSDANTIDSTTGNIEIIPNGANSVKIGAASGATSNNLEILNGAGIQFYEPFVSGTNYSQFFQEALSNNIEYSLPTVAPFLGNFLRNTSELSSASELTWDDSVYNQNFLINAGFSIWQRGISFTSSTFFPNNNNTYFADYWKLQSNGNNIVSIAPGVGPTNLSASCPLAATFTVVTPNTKFGIVQFLENKDTLNAMGYFSSIGFFAKASAGGNNITNLRCSLIQWSGTADAPTSGIVSAWNASGTNPTLAAGWTYVTLSTGSIANLPVTASYTLLTNNPDGMHPFSIPSGSTNNLAVFIWVDNTTIDAAETLTISAVKYEEGFYNTRFLNKPFVEELSNCKRLFWKDLPYGTPVGAATFPATPTTPITVASQCYHPVVLATTANGTAYARVDYPVEMRIAGAPVTYPYTTTTNTNIWSTNAGVDLAANSAAIFASDTKGFLVYNNSGGNLVTAGNLTIIGHAYNDAGF